MAKLLFITQKIDKDDDVLGVYHHWIEELAKKVESIKVVCLYQGRTELPENVQVFSLGKESGPSRFKYIFRFYKYIWLLRKEYDSVFVHMNPIYIVLGGLFWKLNGNKIFLWYNHPLGNFLARVGIFWADKVFCTSPYSFSAKYRKTELMPAGIDTNLFRKIPDMNPVKNRILCLGRISPIKKIDCLIKAAKILNKEGIDFEVLIVGSPTSFKDKYYEQELKKDAEDLVNSGVIIFKNSVSNNETMAIYSSSTIYINLTPTGSFDKTILEAMACELPVIISNAAFSKILPKNLKDVLMFEPDNFKDLAGKIKGLLKSSNGAVIGKELRSLVQQNHDLERLTDTISKRIRNQ